MKHSNTELEHKRKELQEAAVKIGEGIKQMHALENELQVSRQEISDKTREIEQL